MSDTSPARPATHYGTWIPGIVLISLGVIFLVQNYLGQRIHNWWALFLLIPTFFTLERGYASYRAGRTGEAIGQLTGALVLVALVVIFLLDLPFRQLWPVFLIIGGLSLLLARGRWSS